MFKKELHETLKTLGGLLLTTLGTLLFSYGVLRFVFDYQMAFNEFMMPVIWFATVVMAFYLGASMFNREYGNNTFEYFFSLPMGRRKALLFKIVPRFLALVVVLILHVVIFAIADSPASIPSKWYILVLLFSFMYSTSHSLLSLKAGAGLIVSIFGFIAKLVLVYMVLEAFHMNEGKVMFPAFATVLGISAVVMFTLFVLRFDKFDMSNMVRKSRQTIIYGLAPVAVLVLMFVLVNRFDIPEPPGGFSRNDMVAASYDASNGFYRFWTLNEPEGADIESPEVLDKYRRLFDPAEGDKRDLSIHNWDHKAYRARSAGWRDMLGMNLYPDPGKDTGHYLETRLLELEPKIDGLRPKIAFMTERYHKLVNTSVVTDFTAAFRWDVPVFDHLIWIRLARFYVAAKALDAMNGDWQQGVDAIIKHVEFNRKLSRNSRVFITNLLTKEMARFSLEALATIMNRPDCPPEVFQQVLTGLPPLAGDDFSSSPSLTFEYVVFKAYLESGIKKDNRVYGDVFDSLGAKLFLQENRTLAYLLDDINELIHLEAAPPHQWTAEEKINRPRRLIKKTFWWLINPVGKMLYASRYARGNNPVTAAKTHRVRIVYQLTRIAAELHLKDDPSKPVSEVLGQLETYKTPDPGSNRPFIWNGKKGVFYSVAVNGKDDGGLPGQAGMDDDFVIPVKLKDRQ